MSSRDAPSDQQTPPEPSESSLPIATRMFRQLLATHHAPDGRPWKLAEIARATGVPVAYLRELRHGAFAMPSLERAHAIAAFFGVEAAYFLGQQQTKKAVKRQSGAQDIDELVGAPEGKWYKLTVRLEEEQYQPLLAVCRQWHVAPTVLVREFIAALVPDLEAIAPALRERAGETTAGRAVGAAEVLQALALAYEQQAARYRQQSRQLGTDVAVTDVLDGNPWATLLHAVHAGAAAPNPWADVLHEETTGTTEQASP